MKNNTIYYKYNLTQKIILYIKANNLNAITIEFDTVSDNIIRGITIRQCIFRAFYYCGTLHKIDKKEFEEALQRAKTYLSSIEFK